MHASPMKLQSVNFTMSMHNCFRTRHMSKEIQGDVASQWRHFVSQQYCVSLWLQRITKPSTRRAGKMYHEHVNIHMALRMYSSILFVHRNHQLPDKYSPTPLMASLNLLPSMRIRCPCGLIPASWKALFASLAPSSPTLS